MVKQLPQFKWTKSVRYAGIFLLMVCSFSMSSQFSYYFGNIHSQTSYSDGNKDSSSSGLTKPLQAYNYAKASQQIDFYGISDHNHQSAGMTSPSHFHMGVADANAANADGSFVALYGQEWGVISGGGHVIVYGCDSLMGWDTGDYDIYVAQSNYANLWGKINARPGSFAYLAHPQQTDYTNLFTSAYNSTADNAIIGMAARSGPAFSTNSTYSNPSTSDYTARYQEALAQGYHLGIGLDHDTHNSVFGRQTAGRLAVLAPGLTRYNILSGIRNMHMYSTDDWNAQVDFNISNQPMGSIYAHAGSPTLNVTITDPDVESTSSIKIYYGVPGSGSLPTVLTSNTGASTLTYTHATTNGSVYYYYAEITQADGDVLWTSPIWYTTNSTITGTPPVTSFSVPASVCVGQPISLTDMSTNSPNAWQWTMIGATNNSSTTQNPVATYTASGTYTITLVSYNSVGVGVPYTRTVSVGGSSPTVSISGGSTICAGNNLNLSGNGATSYTWSTGATSSSITVSPTSTTVYTLTGSNGGCAASVTKTVTVSSSPAVAINGASGICTGSSVNLSATGATSYTWSTGSNAGNITVSPTSTTVYTLTGSNGGSCSGTTTATVTVTSSPTVSISGGSTICAGNNLNLSGNGATSYTWSTGSNAGSITVSPTSTTVYTLTGSNGGCAAVTTKTVTVSSSPAVTINGANNICPGNSVNLSATGATNYTWSTGSNAGSITVSPTSTTVYTLTGSNGGCAAAATKTITVNSLPAVSISGSNTDCSGGSIVLSGNGANTYTWSTAATTSTISVSPSATTSYSITGTDANGCQNTSVKTVTVTGAATISAAGGTICPGYSFTITPSGAATYTYSGGSAVVSPASTQSYTVTGTASGGCAATPAIVTVTVTPGLSVSISGPNFVCAGSTVMLNANGASTYTWNTGITGSSISVSPAISTSYSVAGSNAGCSGSGTKFINVYSLPTVNANTSSSMLCTGQSATLSAGGANTYAWSNSQTGASIVVSPASTTSYTVTGTDVHGCSANATVTETVSVCTGIQSYEPLAGTAVYPNPNNGSFVVNVNTSSLLTIYDLLGNVVLQQKLEEGPQDIHISDKANGVYYLRITSGDKQTITRILKQ